MATRRTSHN